MGQKYAGIRDVSDLYQLMVIGDTLMTFAFAMLVVAFAVAFAGDSMFPDETDFRILTPLPITRGFVFAAKLRAVAWCLGLAIVVSSLALQLPFTAITGGPHADRTWVVRAAVSSGVSIAASFFAATAVMAVQGAIVLCAPRRYLRPMAVGTRTAILCGVVLLLPLAGRMPSQARGLAAESALAFLAPPAWFVGLLRTALGVATCGVGWSLNGLLGGGLIQWLQEGGVAPPRLVSSAATMPFVLLLAGCAGLRAALMLPEEPRANWTFRMREDDAHRGAQLDSVERLFKRLVIWPVLIGSLPLQWAVFGANAVATLPIAYLTGVILVELFIRGWRRIPFTCGYIPGKRNVALSFLIALVSYVLFTFIGTGLTALGRFHPSRLLIATGILMMAVALLRRYRLRSWGQAPLMFDDDPPEFAQPLQLL